MIRDSTLFQSLVIHFVFEPKAYKIRLKWAGLTSRLALGCFSPPWSLVTEGWYPNFYCNQNLWTIYEWERGFSNRYPWHGLIRWKHCRELFFPYILDHGLIASFYLLIRLGLHGVEIFKLIFHLLQHRLDFSQWNVTHWWNVTHCCWLSPSRNQTWTPCFSK